MWISIFETTHKSTWRDAGGPRPRYTPQCQEPIGFRVGRRQPVWADKPVNAGITNPRTRYRPARTSEAKSHLAEINRIQGIERLWWGCRDDPGSLFIREYSQEDKNYMYIRLELTDLKGKKKAIKLIRREVRQPTQLYREGHEEKRQRSVIEWEGIDPVYEDKKSLKRWS